MPKPCFGCDRAEFLQGAGTGRRPARGGRRSFAAEPSFGRLACGPNPRLAKAQSRSCWRMDWRMRFSRRETCTCVIPRRRATSVWVFLR